MGRRTGRRRWFRRKEPASPMQMVRPDLIRRSTNFDIVPSTGAARRRTRRLAKKAGLTSAGFEARRVAVPENPLLPSTLTAPVRQASPPVLQPRRADEAEIDQKTDPSLDEALADLVEQLAPKEAPKQASEQAPEPAPDPAPEPVPLEVVAEEAARIPVKVGLWFSDGTELLLAESDPLVSEFVRAADRMMRPARWRRIVGPRVGL